MTKRFKSGGVCLALLFPVAVLAAGFASTAFAIGEDEALRTGRQVAESVTDAVRNKVQSTVEESGPDKAVGVCYWQSDALLREAQGRYGVTVRRVSSKPRNPKNMAQGIEADLVRRFTEEEAKGAISSEIFERRTEAGKSRAYYYAKPLQIRDFCLQCHGDPASIPQEVKDALASKYPDDLAVGFHEGDIAGAVVVTIPEE